MTFVERWARLWRSVGVAIFLSQRAHEAARRGSIKLTAYALIHGRDPVWHLDPETLDVVIDDDPPIDPPRRLVSTFGSSLIAAILGEAGRP